MTELLDALPPGARVLDLGCRTGSFRDQGRSLRAIRIDLEAPHAAIPNFAQADAARLPFPDRSFDLVVSNHSLEHFENLSGALREISRVVKSGGSLFISVPDSTTFTDRLYRWLSRGGGHVNAFSSADALAAKVQDATGIKHIATRTLCTSLSFLNRKNVRGWPPRRLLLFGGGTEASLRFFNVVSRLSDLFLRTRLSVYGWAFYFGNFSVPIDCRAWSNVCIRCGSGHPAERLAPEVVRRSLLFPAYSCPDCGTWNFFARDNPRLK